MTDDPKALAIRLGAIFHGQITHEEIKFPGLSKAAQALLNSNPELYGSILQALLDGNSVNQTAKTTKQPPPLVRFISRQHPEIKEVNRSQTIANLEESLTTLSSRLCLEAHNLPIRDVPRTIATTTEQLALLTGHATQRIEVNNAPSREKLLDMFKALSLKDFHTS